MYAYVTENRLIILDYCVIVHSLMYEVNCSFSQCSFSEILYVKTCKTVEGLLQSTEQ